MELLLEHDATVVGNMMSRDVLNVSFTLPSSPPEPFDVELVVNVPTSKHRHQQSSPKAAVLAEVHVGVVVHGMSWLRSVEVYFVCLHEGLEFHSVLGRHKLRVDEVVVQIIVNVRLMEPSWWRHCFASEVISVLLRQTTLVVAEVVDVVHITLLFKLFHALFSVAALLGSVGGYIAIRRTEIDSVCAVELVLGYNSVVIWVLLAQKVV